MTYLLTYLMIITEEYKNLAKGTKIVGCWIFQTTDLFFQSATFFARFMFKALVVSITINILVVSGNRFYCRPNFTVFPKFCFKFIGKLGNLMINLRFANVLYAFSCLKMMSNLPLFFPISFYFLLFLQLHSETLRFI